MDGHLTSADMMAFNVLQATTLNTAPPAPAPKEKGALGTRAFNLCGWVHLQLSELNHLHRCNEGGWIHYNKASNKVEKEAVVDAYFVQPLVRKNGRFRQILTTKFRDLIITWRLAPSNELQRTQTTWRFGSAVICHVFTSRTGEPRILTNHEHSNGKSNISRYRTNHPRHPQNPQQH
jgi:hypothetical protein